MEGSREHLELSESGYSEPAKDFPWLLQMSGNMTGFSATVWIETLSVSLVVLSDALVII